MTTSSPHVASVLAAKPIFSSELGSIAERDLPRFPFTPVDPLIVARPNPRDPVG